MFGHDTNDHNNQNDDTPGAPLPPDPVVDELLDEPSSGLTPAISPSNDNEEDTSTSASDVSSTADDNDNRSNTAPDTDDLLSIKQQALQQLTPLVDHLDQTPEEKFRTTMMMIQGSDNQSLIKDAYAAAQKITDDKARAQALLDIVNEINYFTHRSTE